MIGESAKHRDTLAKYLPQGQEIVCLPREAASSDQFDDQIGAQDVVISLKYSRKGCTPPAFRMLHVPGAGLDGVDFASLPGKAWVCNVFEHEIPIAEYVFAAMLDHEIGYARMHADFSAQRWPELYRSRVAHGELHGKTICLIGYGRIGIEVARRASAFGMNVQVVNRSAVRAGLEFTSQTHLMDQLGSVVGMADYVVIACPLTEETRDLIDAELLSKMQRHSVLINVSRAGIIDQKALYRALCDDRLGGAVLDVWWHYPATDTDKPAPFDYPFDSLPNVRLTAHSSAWTRRLPERRYRVIAQNITNLINSEPLLNVVRSP